jgi:flavodoxin
MQFSREALRLPQILRKDTAMKKLSGILMSLASVLILSACGNNNTGPDNTAPSSSNPTISNENEAESQSKTDAEQKTLVVFYSATGNTKKIANFIEAATGADVFELIPTKPYTDGDLNWRDGDSRVSHEHNNPDYRDVSLVANTAPNWNSYDTVFIGYPIWWGVAAWPVNGFVKANDFAGKTVIPFCTSGSSGLGESGDLLSELAKTGNWIEGKRFSSGDSEQTVQAWINELNRTK